MFKIGLDLAFRTVGVAVRSPTKLYYDSLDLSGKKMTKEEIQNTIIDWIFQEISPYIYEKHQLIIEDLFYGRNFEAIKNAARVQGGVQDRYYCKTHKKPEYILATTARKKVGVKAWSSKPELQLFAIDKFKLALVDSEIRTTLTSLLSGHEKEKLVCSFLGKEAKTKVGKEKIVKRLSNSKRILSNALNRLSNKIKKVTGINEHMADAIVLVASKD